MLMFKGALKSCFFLRIQGIRHLKEDDSPPANNKAPRILADGKPAVETTREMSIKYTTREKAEGDAAPRHLLK